MLPSKLLYWVMGLSLSLFWAGPGHAEITQATNAIVKEKSEKAEAKPPVVSPVPIGTIELRSGSSKTESSKESRIELKAVWEQQQKLRVDYEQKKKELHNQLQKILKEEDDGGSGPSSRQNLIKENNQEQEELRKSFQEEYRKLQAQERKIRFGRESLERPLFANPDGQVKKEVMDEKQKRLDFQKRKEEQDKILDRIRQEEVRQQPPRPTPSRPIQPGFTPPKTSPPPSAPQTNPVRQY